MSEWWSDEFARTYKQDATQEEALAAGERLLSRPDFPHQEQLRKNLTYWLPKLPGTNHDITIPVEEGWSCFNPSIAAGPDGELRAIIRTANYVMSDTGYYGGAYDREGVIRTKNYLVEFTPSLEQFLFNPQRIIDDHLRPDPSLYPVQGFEDCRLFYHRGWKFSATVRERNTRGICQQVMCSLNGNRATRLVELSPAHDTHHKNWMYNGRNYTSRPGFVQKCYQDTWHYPWSKSQPYTSHAFRGGSQLVPVALDEYLAVIHESVDFPGQSPHRVYWHRLVMFHRGHITRISQPFCFQRRGVEFAAGMARHGDDLLISYGVADKEAWLHRMPLKDALSMLYPVEDQR